MDIDGLYSRSPSKLRALPTRPTRASGSAPRLQCVDGSVFVGTNIENRSFGLTTCAERNALAAAIGAGKRDFTIIVVATPDAEYPVSPCGACRQVLSEFLAPEAAVIFGSSAKDLVVTTIGQLYPNDALHELKGRH